MIYVAYGSNLHKGQMAYRCPAAQPIGAFMLNGWRLVFRGVADVVRDKDASCPVGLWRITPECEKKLDIYEGFPTLYRKEYIEHDGETLMIYVMNRTDISMPNEGYLQTIIEGYQDFFLDSRYLIDAVRYTSEHLQGIGHTPRRYAK